MYIKMINQIIKAIVCLVLAFIVACLIVAFNLPRKDLPVSIKVGTETISIVHAPMKEVALGMYEPFIHQITINTEISMDRATEIEVIVHEVIHAINHRVKMASILNNPELSPYEKEEMIVSALTPYLVQIFRDNNIPLE